MEFGIEAAWQLDGAARVASTHGRLRQRQPNFMPSMDANNSGGVTMCSIPLVSILAQGRVSTWRSYSPVITARVSHNPRETLG